MSRGENPTTMVRIEQNLIKKRAMLTRPSNLYSNEGYKGLYNNESCKASYNNEVCN